MDTEVWQDDTGKIDKAPDKYIEIENMSPSDSYRVMEDFVYSIDDKFLKNKLAQAIWGHKHLRQYRKTLG